jgi:adenylate kinase
MTAAQKAARVKFNKAIAIRKKTGCTLKEAFAQVYGKKVGAVKKKAAKKKAAPKKKAVKKSAVKRKPASKKEKISEQAILNKIHRVKHNVDVLDEAQHKHMMGGKLKLSKGESRLGLVKKQPKSLGLAEQIGAIKMGSTFIYYKGWGIEKRAVSVKDSKKKSIIYIVHELQKSFHTLAAAKSYINHIAR